MAGSARCRLPGGPAPALLTRRSPGRRANTRTAATRIQDRRPPAGLPPSPCYTPGARRPEVSMAEEILPSLYRIVVPLPGNPLKEVNSYVITASERNLVIDTGMNRPECLEALG